MPLFIVATTKAEIDPLLKDRITENFPTDHYEIGRGQWLVSFNGTATELYKKLSPEYTQEKQPYPLQSTVVFGIAGYFGIASIDMWEWVRTRLGSKSA
jgi:hypothetical protein